MPDTTTVNVCFIFCLTISSLNYWAFVAREKKITSKNGVLRRIFGPNKEEVAGGWRGLHNEELYNLYISSYINRVIKSRKIQ